MQDRFFASVGKGMTVEDADGDKIGTVGAIFQPTQVSSTASTTARPVGEAFMKVATGFLGLGKDLYIPTSAIRNVTEGPGDPDGGQGSGGHDGLGSEAALDRRLASHKKPPLPTRRSGEAERPRRSCGTGRGGWGPWG